VVSRDRRRDDVRTFVRCQNTGKIRRSGFRRMSKYGQNTAFGFFSYVRLRQNTAFGFSSDVNIRAKYGVRIYVGLPKYGLNTTLRYSSDTEYDARGC